MLTGKGTTGKGTTGKGTTGKGTTGKGTTGKGTTGKGTTGKGIAEYRCLLDFIANIIFTVYAHFIASFGFRVYFRLGLTSTIGSGSV